MAQTGWTEIMAPPIAGGGALVDFDAAGGVDLDRLERSLELRGERICKHIRAALLREGNDRVVAALGRLLGRWRDGGGEHPGRPHPDRKAA